MSAPTLHAPLQLQSTIGFEGGILDGVHAHPDGEHLVYAVGSSVVLRHLKTNEQRFLTGHTHNVSCLAVSRSGKYIASGQQNYMGFKGDVMVWLYGEARVIGSHTVHKVKVVSVAVSANDKYVASLGGQDDGSAVIYDIEAGDTLCGVTASMATQGNSVVLRFGSVYDDLLVTAGDYVMRVWKIDQRRSCMTPLNLPPSGVKRKIRCLQVDADDKYVYCGTTSGDVLMVRLGYEEGLAPSLMASYAKAPQRFNRKNMEGELFRMGVWSILLVCPGEFLLGTGTGAVYRVRESCVRPQTAVKLLKCAADRLLDVVNVMSVSGRVTTLSTLSDQRLLCATAACHLYTGDLQRLTLHNTGHPSEVKQVIFPRSCSVLFVTCSAEDVRVWHAVTGRELLRMTVPNFICQCVCLTADDTTILSGWNDGIIRAFCAESGALKYVIRDAHNRGVTAITTPDNGGRIISGGDEGQVRIWDMCSGVARLVKTFNEHRKSVTCLRLTCDGEECVSASTDGSCIVWDIRTYRRKVALFANCSFTGACYGWKECQLITCGTDKKLAYWEIYDGSLVRAMEVSNDGPVNAMDMTSDDKYIVIGGHDKLVKVFRYEEGDCIFVGRGHSSPICSLKISPDGRSIVSVGNDGSILIWKAPCIMSE